MALGLGASGGEMLHGQFEGEWLCLPSPPRAGVTYGLVLGVFGERPSQSPCAQEQKGRSPQGQERRGGAQAQTTS